MRRVLLVVCAVYALTGCGSSKAPRSGAPPRRTGAPIAAGTLPPGANTWNGSALFARECAACHGAGGAGGPVGPALRGEHTRKSYAQVRAIVADPDPPMPKLFPARISAADVRDVSAYVESL